MIAINASLELTLQNGFTEEKDEKLEPQLEKVQQEDTKLALSATNEKTVVADIQTAASKMSLGTSHTTSSTTTSTWSSPGNLR